MEVILLNDKERLEAAVALFHHAMESIIIFNKDSKIIMVNSKTEDLFGYTKEEMVGKKMEFLLPSKFNERHSQLRKIQLSNNRPMVMGTGEAELMGRKKNGSEFPVEISLTDYATEQGFYVMAFVVDITIRKQAEDNLRKHSIDLERQVTERTMILREAIKELEQTKEDLTLALSKEKELNGMKSRFVSMASHEFRTPLATILSSISLVDKYVKLQDTEKQLKHINRIKTAVTSMTDILNGFLSVGKLDEGMVMSSNCTFNIVDFIEEIRPEMQVVAKENQKIICHYNGDIDNNEVCLDKKLLRNVLINLISNAIKFSNEGQSINVTTTLTSPELVIEVKDKGIGIPEKDQKHLFERFFRAHNATNIQGTGLGLNIVTKYIELMNGKIEFTSKLNEGTTFTVKFPQERKLIKTEINQ